MHRFETMFNRPILRHDKKINRCFSIVKLNFPQTWYTKAWIKIKAQLRSRKILFSKYNSKINLLSILNFLLHKIKHKKSF